MTSLYVYLAEPIDQANGRIFSERLRLELMQRQVSWYSPLDAWSWYNDQFSPNIQATNDRALDGAAAVVACLPKGIPTIGVPLEIGRASACFKPIIVLSSSDRESSAAMIGTKVHWFEDAANAAAAALAICSTSRPEMAIYNASAFIEMKEPLQGRWSGPGVAPQGHHEGDAGYDLTSSESISVGPHHRVSVQCGICVEMPPGYWALVQGRSSSWNRGLSVKASVIDAGYRGPLWVDVLNLLDQDIFIEKGERIAQLIPMPLCPPIVWTQVEQLSPSSRGTNGYGSTGK